MRSFLTVASVATPALATAVEIPLAGKAAYEGDLLAGAWTLDTRFDPQLNKPLKDVTFDPSTSHQCDDILDISSIPDLHDKTCAVRCANSLPGDLTDPACEGHNIAYDQDDPAYKNTLCLADTTTTETNDEGVETTTTVTIAEFVQAHCKGIDGCHAYDIDSSGYGGHRVRLCSSTSSSSDSNHNMWTEDLTWSVYSDQKCNLGVGLKVHTPSGFVTSPEDDTISGWYDQPHGTLGNSVDLPFVNSDNGASDVYAADSGFTMTWSSSCKGFVLSSPSGTDEDGVQFTGTDLHTTYDPCTDESGLLGDCARTCSSNDDDHFFGVASSATSSSFWNLYDWSLSVSISIVEQPISNPGVKIIDNTFVPHNNFNSSLPLFTETVSADCLCQSTSTCAANDEIEHLFSGSHNYEGTDGTNTVAFHDFMACEVASTCADAAEVPQIDANGEQIFKYFSYKSCFDQMLPAARCQVRDALHPGRVAVDTDPLSVHSNALCLRNADVAETFCRAHAEFSSRSYIFIFLIFNLFDKFIN